MVSKRPLSAIESAELSRGKRPALTKHNWSSIIAGSDDYNKPYGLLLTHVVPKSKTHKREPEFLHSARFKEELEHTYSPTPAYSHTAPKRLAVALDCETVGCTDGIGEVRELVLFTAVDFLTGEILIDTIVATSGNYEVKQWTTRFFGVMGKQVREAKENGSALDGFKDARNQLFHFVDEQTILVSWTFNKVTRALHMSHPNCIDAKQMTAAAMRNLVTKGEPKGLKETVKLLIGREIQEFEGLYCCLENVMAIRELVLWCTFYFAELRQLSVNANHEYTLSRSTLDQKVNRLIIDDEEWNQKLEYLRKLADGEVPLPRSMEGKFTLEEHIVYIQQQVDAAWFVRAKRVQCIDATAHADQTDLVIGTFEPGAAALAIEMETESGLQQSPPLLLLTQPQEDEQTSHSFEVQQDDTVAIQTNSLILPASMEDDPPLEIQQAPPTPSTPPQQPQSLIIRERAAQPAPPPPPSQPAPPATIQASEITITIDPEIEIDPDILAEEEEEKQAAAADQPPHQRPEQADPRRRRRRRSPS